MEETPNLGRCGEIFHLKDFEFCFFCTFCNKEFDKFNNFVTHLKNEHISTLEHSFPYNIKQEEPLEVDDFDETNRCDSQLYITDDQVPPIKETFIVPSSNEFFVIEDHGTDNFIKNEPSVEIYLNEEPDTDVTEINDIEDDIGGSTIQKSTTPVKTFNNFEDMLEITLEENNESTEMEKTTEKKRYYRNFPMVKCEICGETLRDKYCLKAHKKRRHGMVFEQKPQKAKGENLKPGSCEICHATFRNKYILKTHLQRVHKLEHFKSQMNSLFHENSENIINKALNIKKYNKSNSTETKLPPPVVNMELPGNSEGESILIDEEEIYIKPEPRGFQEKNIPNADEYVNHMMDMARQSMEKNAVDQTDNKCEICAKEFSNKYQLKRHEVIHTEERRFKCDICGYATYRNYNLKTHLLRHKGIKPFVCSICGRSFTSSTDRKSHMRTHTKEKRSYCHQCDKDFVSAYCLERHMLAIHSAHRQKCRVCGKLFEDTSGTGLHENCRGLKSRFSCQLCDSAFRSIHDLDQHKLTHEAIEILS